MTDEDLTTTSYAILGHLAMQPWTMYALAAQMRRNVSYFYPRAESRVYEEPKRLVVRGLARAKKLKAGGRTTTVYSITPAGRAALKAWLAAPVGKGPALEFEGLLRVFLAPFGREQDLRSALEQVRAEIAGLTELADRIGGEYLAGEAPFQRYAPTRAMVHDFLSHFGRLVDDWAVRSIDQLSRWERTDEEERTADALLAFQRNRIAAPVQMAPVAD